MGIRRLGVLCPLKQEAMFVATPLNKLEVTTIGAIGVPVPEYSGYSKYRSQTGFKADNGDERRSPLEYLGVTSRTTSYQLLANGSYTYWDAGSEYFSVIQGGSSHQALINKVWSRLFDKIHGDTADLGESLGEIRQTHRMIADRFESVEQLARRDFVRFRRIARSLPKRFKVFADWWLEYQFGWKPLVNDITSALQVVSRPPMKPKRFRSKGHIDLEFEQNLSHNPLRVGSGVQSVAMSCYASVSNPNLVLLNNLGLANPVLTLWNLTPWSFVADWLFDVSTFLGAYTDAFGYDIDKAYTTVFQRGQQSQSYATGIGGPSLCQSVVLYRAASLLMPAPNLAVFANIGDSLVRATNAIALLVQLLSRPR